MGVRLRMTLLAAATFALVTACGNGGDGGKEVASLSEPSSTPSEQQQSGVGHNPAEDEKKMKEFAKCMREHGVDMPDPKSSPGGGAVVEKQEGDPEQMKTAQEACRKLLPNGGEPPKLDAAQLDEMRKQAKCMREHGVNMPDPDPNSPGMRLEGDIDDELLKKAFEACGNGAITGGGGAVGHSSGGPGLGIEAPGGGK